MKKDIKYYEDMITYHQEEKTLINNKIKLW